MSTRFDAGVALSIKTPAFAVISGAISGTTPKVSGWIKLVGVESMQFALTTTSTANGVWSAETATGSLGQNAKPLDNPPTFPTGTSQNSTVTVTMEGTEFVYLRLTFTPSAGSGNANANCGLVTGFPVNVSRDRQLGLLYSGLAADTLAGTNALEIAANWDGRTPVGGPSPIPAFNNSVDPVVWAAAVDSSGSAISVAAKVASTVQSLPLRLGVFEFNAFRCKFVPTAGFGTYKVFFNAKN